MASKCSKPNPMGSISRWHDAHVGFSTCSTISCRRPFGLLIDERIRQRRNDAGRRRRHVLAEQPLANEDAARRRRRVGRSGRRRQERALAENARAIRSCRELHHLELFLRRRQTVHLGQLRRQEAVIRRQRFHEVAIVPDEMMQQRARLLGHRERQLRRERLKPVCLHRIDHAIEAQPFFEELIERLASPAARSRACAAPRARARPPCSALLSPPPRTAHRPASCSRAGTTAGSRRRSPCTVRRVRLRRGTGSSATAASLRRRRARRRGSGGSRAPARRRRRSTASLHLRSADVETRAARTCARTHRGISDR